MKKVNSILIGAAMIIVAACNKPSTRIKESAPLPESTAVASNAQYFSSSAANPANAFDSAGIIHNQALAAVAMYGNSSGDHSVPGAFSQISNYFERRYGTSKIHSAETFYWQSLPAMLINTDSFLVAQKIAPSIRKYITPFVTDVLALQDFDPASYKKLVMEYEQRVISDKQLNGEEQRLLLASLSIARHSGFYWSEKFGNKPLADMRKKRSIFRKIAAFAASVVGDCIAAVGLDAAGAPLNDLVEISVTGSEAMYFWIVGSYSYGG